MICMNSVFLFSLHIDLLINASSLPLIFSTVPTIAYAKSLGRIPGGHFWAGSFSMLSLRGGGFKYWLYIFTLVGEDLTNLFHLTWNHHLRPSLISVFSYFFHISDSCIGDRVCSRAIRWRFLSHLQRSSFAAASADAHGLAQEMQKLRTEHQEAEKRNDTLEKQMQEDLFWVMNIDVEKIQGYSNHAIWGVAYSKKIYFDEWYATKGTNSWPLKIGALETFLSFWGPAYLYT